MEMKKDIEEIEEKDLNQVIDDIIELVKEKKYSIMRKQLLNNNAVDIADILEAIMDRLDVEKAIIAFRMLPKDVSVEVFAYLPVEDQVEIINEITQREIDHIMEELAFDDMIDVLEELPANLVDKILEKTSKEERRLINTFLNYPENSAGSLMTIDYIALKKSMTVAAALAHIKSAGIDSETVYNCYVTDSQRTLEGAISLRTLVLADSDQTIENLMYKDMIFVNVLDDQESVSNTFKRYDFLALPVVDKETRIVGIITVDDIIDVIDEENTEDFQRMAGVTAGKEEYLDMSVFAHVRTRLPWLFILMCSYMITGGIIASFEGVLSQVISLVSYMPMLMGTGGNSGSQSSTLIIRGMTLEEIELKDFGRVLWKEFQIGILIGIALSILNFLRICFLDGNGPMVALTVCIAMLVIVMAAKITGSMLPMLAKAIKIDPALMAAPMISSLTDMISVITYFALATLILGIH